MNQKLTGFVYGVDASSMFSLYHVSITKRLDCSRSLSCSHGHYQPFQPTLKMVVRRRNAILEIVGGVMVGAAGAFVTQITI